MRFVKRRFRAMQNSNQVDHHIVLCHALRQKCRVVNIPFNHAYTRQILDESRLFGAACDDRHAAAQAGELFANVATDKASTSQ